MVISRLLTYCCFVLCRFQNAYNWLISLVLWKIQSLRKIITLTIPGWWRCQSFRQEWAVPLRLRTSDNLNKLFIYCMKASEIQPSNEPFSRCWESLELQIQNWLLTWCYEGFKGSDKLWTIPGRSVVFRQNISQPHWLRLVSAAYLFTDENIPVYELTWEELYVEVIPFTNHFRNPGIQKTCIYQIH